MNINLLVHMYKFIIDFNSSNLANMNSTADLLKLKDLYIFSIL